MLLRKQATPFDYQNSPYVSAYYRPGQVCGVIGNAFRPPDVHLAAYERSWLLIPQAMREYSATGQGVDVRPRPLRWNIFGSDNAMAAYFNAVTNAGGIYFPERVDWRGNNIGVLNAPEVIRQTFNSNGTTLDSGTLYSTSHLHEYGHSIDYTWQANPNTNLTGTARWHAIIYRAFALGVPYVLQFTNYGYGFSNPTEWFAEVFATRMLWEQLGGAFLWGSQAGRYRPSLMLFLCGNDLNLYDALLDLLEQEFPLLTPIPRRIFEPGFAGQFPPPQLYDWAAAAPAFNTFPWKVGVYGDNRITPPTPGPYVVRTYSLLSGALPPGLSLTANLAYSPTSAGIWVHGTPAVAGSYSCVLRIKNHTSFPDTDLTLNFTVSS